MSLEAEIQVKSVRGGTEEEKKKEEKEKIPHMFESICHQPL